jgi:hypothetical protein
MADTEKGAGRGRGKFAAAGVQARQALEIEALKEAVGDLADACDELAARVTELEGGDTGA